MLGMLILTGVLALSGCTSNSGNPEAYYDQVMDFQQAVFEQEEMLIQAVNREMDRGISDSTVIDDTAKIPYVRMAYIDFCRQIDSSLASLEKLGPFGEDRSLLEATRSLLEHYKKLSKKEYLEIVTITEIPRADYQSQHDEELQLLYQTIDAELEKDVLRFSTACKTFSTAQGFQIVEYNHPNPQ